MLIKDNFSTSCKSEIRFSEVAISHYVSECQSNERGEFAIFLQKVSLVTFIRGGAVRHWHSGDQCVSLVFTRGRHYDDDQAISKTVPRISSLFTNTPFGGTRLQFRPYGRHLKQEALLWQRDRATLLSVEILQLHPI